jgi:hypothetical protein
MMFCEWAFAATMFVDPHDAANGGSASTLYCGITPLPSFSRA